MASQTSVDGTPTNGLEPLIDSLVWGGAWRPSFTGSEAIGYSFQSGWSEPQHAWSQDTVEFFGEEWTAADIQAMEVAFQAWSNVANISFVEEPAYYSDIHYWLLTDAQTNDFLGENIAGYHDVPEPYNIDELHAYFNVESYDWGEGGLQRGGGAYALILHELGHGLGLAHPHDGGLEADRTTFPGVFDADDLGDYELNQGIWTVMTYNQGWNREPAESFSYGYEGTPMALDVAAMQEIYGANWSHATGDDVYRLPTEDGPGAFWSCIWDAGGNDTLSGAYADDAVRIDLREAPLTGPNAGGYVSWLPGVTGGFTIANQVDIENAIGGDGNDVITGNDVANLLEGGRGDDRLFGGDGDDQIIGSAGDDVLVGEGDHDELYGGDGSDRLYGGEGEDRLYGHDGDDLLEASVGDDVAYGGHDDDIVIGREGDDTLAGESGDDGLYGGHGDDRLFGGDGVDELFGHTGEDELSGGSGDDILAGGGGDDVLRGGEGHDRLWGGTGSDLFVIDADTEGADWVYGFTWSDEVDFSSFGLSAETVVERSWSRDGYTAIDADDDGSANVVLFDYTGFSVFDIA